MPNGTYDVTVTVGEARYHSTRIEHSVQVEGVSVHDRASTTLASPFVTRTVRVVVDDESIDLGFEGGARTKIVSIQARPTSAPPPVEPPEPPTEPQEPHPGATNYSFTNRSAPAGWNVASGRAFDGTHGWVAADGLKRQCGVRGIEPDAVLDSFCHATTRYTKVDGVWISTPSPATCSPRWSPLP